MGWVKAKALEVGKIAFLAVLTAWKIVCVELFALLVKFAQMPKNWEMAGFYIVFCFSVVHPSFQFVCKEEVFDKEMAILEMSAVMLLLPSVVPVAQASKLLTNRPIGKSRYGDRDG